MNLKKIIVFAVTLSLLLSGMLVAIRGEAIDRGEVNERIKSETDQREIDNSSNFEITITSPEEDEYLEKNESVMIEYEVENTGEIEGSQEIVQSVNGEKVDVTEKTIGAGMIEPGQYKFNASYWSEQFTIENVELDSIWSPDTVEVGKEFEVNGTGYYDYVFPEMGEVALRDDHMDDYRFTIRNESDSDTLIEVPAEKIDLTPKENYSTFEGSVPTEGLESGNYTLKLEALEEGMTDYRSVSKNLTLIESKSDYEKSDIGEIIDFRRTEKNLSRERFEIDLGEMKEEKEYELEVSSEDDEDSVTVSIIEEREAKEIHDWHDLDGMRDDLDGNYVLMNDLDEETDGYDELVDTEDGWEPIGEYIDRLEPPPITEAFAGNFDGNGHTISDLEINRKIEDGVGLFAIVEGEIKAVDIVDVEVKGERYVGGVVGLNRGSVKNSSASGNVSGNGRVGGLVGSNSGLIVDSDANGNVSGNGRVGGLVGRNSGLIVNSDANGNVSGGGLVGGLVGYNWETVKNSYAMANVSGQTFIGGLVGRNRDGTVVNSHYNIDDVLINGDHHVTLGGLFEEQYSDWTSNKELNIDDYDSLIPVDGFYEINDVQGIRDLLGFGGMQEYKFRLTEDIDLSSEPGLHIPYMAANFDGNGHVISNLHLNLSFSQYVGLFGRVSAEYISDISVVDAEVRGNYYVGTLIGDNQATVENSYATGNVSGNGYIGGLVGRSYGMVENSYAIGNVNSRNHFSTGGLIGESYNTVKNSYAEGNVNGEGFVGGLVGSASSIVNNSYATGEVNGRNQVGGLIGRSTGTVENSFATGDVNGSKSRVGGLAGMVFGSVDKSYATGEVTAAEDVEDVGGLVGYLTSGGAVSNSFATGNVNGSDERVGGLTGMNLGKLSNTYATGDVIGIEEVGGLVGRNWGDTVEKSYATGDVNGEDDGGGLVGRNWDGTVVNSFWDIETSGQEDSDGGSGKTTAEMKDVATYTDMDTEGLEEPWDFVGNPYDDEDDEDIWNIDEDKEINDGYPFLSWEEIEEPETYELNLNIEGEGTVTAHWDDEEHEVEDEETLEIEENTEVWLQVDPEDDWKFEGWTGDHDGAESDLMVKMDEDKELTANFEEIDYTLNFIVEDIDGEPIEGANVEINGIEKETDKDGEVIFEEMEPATWDYTVEKDGYETVEDNVTIDEDLTETVTLKEEDDGIPGFTSTLLLLATVIAVAIYKKKQN